MQENLKQEEISPQTTGRGHLTRARRVTQEEIATKIVENLEKDEVPRCALCKRPISSKKSLETGLGGICRRKVKRVSSGAE